MTKITTGGQQPGMKMVNSHAAAVDIGSTMHMAAVNPDTCETPVRAFGTFTQDLHDLATWFRSCGVTSVAMESTDVYWIPAFDLLEQHGFEVILVNARYAKNVPGRKTDVSDAGWLRQLHSYGLLRGSFRPEAEIAVLRAYLRQRERLWPDGYDQLRQSHRSSGEEGRDQGADRLQAPARFLSRQAVSRGRQHPGSTVRCRCAGQGVGDRHHPCIACRAMDEPARKLP